MHEGTAEGKALTASLAGAGDGLALRFETDVCRTRRVLRVGRSRVEVALDVGSIRAGAATLPLHEVEFELLAGSVADLVAVATRWAGRHHLWLDARSKAERGHLLADSKAASPATKAAAPLLPTRFEARRRVALPRAQRLAACLAQRLGTRGR